MREYAYDIECYKNLFTVTFVDINNGDTSAFFIGFKNNDIEKIREFLREECTLIGYNSISYDDPILRYILSYKGNNHTKDIYTLSKKLINDSSNSDKNILALRYPRERQWKTIDLMKMLAFDKLGVSLKQTAINLKWGRIQDLPYPPESLLSNKSIQTVLDYNLNDVLITKKLYETVSPLLQMRRELGAMYGLDFLSASDSRIANLILEKIYSEETGIPLKRLREMRTERGNILLGDCVGKFVRFISPEMKDLYDRISSRVVYKENDYKYSEVVEYANCKFNLGIGGLHTEDPAGIFETDEDYIIQDMDVSSYYPNLIINNNFYPEHLGEQFIKILEKITDKRIDAKKNGRKTEADGLKITINSIFGKMGFDSFWLYDPKQFLSTTITGQLGLLMLVEGLHMNGIKVISCNTDGIVCKIPRYLEDKYYLVAHAWERLTNLQLEFTQYKKYIRRDVNSYITQKDDGSIKSKGAFLEEVDLRKAFRMPIVAKALRAYFIDGVSIKDTVESEKDIMMFCISQKSGGNFAIEFHSKNGIETLQKTNRFYVSKEGGSLVKREKTDGRVIALQAGKTVSILNEYDETVPFEKYGVDFSFYEEEANKIVDKIIPPQLSLF